MPALSKKRIEDKTMDKRDELRKLINDLIAKIDDERLLRAIYRLANDLYCKH